VLVVDGQNPRLSKLLKEIVRREVRDQQGVELEDLLNPIKVSALLSPPSPRANPRAVVATTALGSRSGPMPTHSTNPCPGGVRDAAS
jgi:hypothetical protein